MSLQSVSEFIAHASPGVYLTREDAEIIFARNASPKMQASAMTMIRAERKEGSLAHYAMASNKYMDGSRASVVDCVALEIAAQESVRV